MRVFTSHRLEDLLDALVEQLRSAPLPPLAAETIVVPGLGLARWLELRLAERLGIAAGIELPLLGAFLHRLTGGSAATGADPFARETLVWRIWRVLSQHKSADAPFGPATDYVRDDEDGRKRLQLCTRLAGAFDEYQLYRDDLLRSFASGHDHKQLSEHAPWQAALWRALLADQGITTTRAKKRTDNATPLLFAELADEPSPSEDRAHRLQQLRQRLGDAAWREANLPPRLTVFGTTTMPPAFLQVLRQLASYLPVALYVPRPTPHFFGHLRERKNHAGDNALLARFGTESREFHEQLLDLDDGENAPADAVPGAGPLDEHPLDDLSDATEPRNLLACLQHDIVQLHDRSAPAAERFVLHPDDDSVRVHDCHSPQRELEVVRDQILQAFDRDDSLQPNDVLVLVTDIHRYAPYAHAVFGPVQHKLPFHVADRSPASELPTCRALLAVLDLANDRLTLASVLHLLETTAVQRRFGLFATDLPPLRHACQAAGIRWGLDGESRHDAFDLPAFDDNSWRQGLDRLLLGTLSGPCDALVAGHAPVADVTDGRNERLARFVTFAETLFDQVRALRTTQPLADWVEQLDELLAALFDEHDPEHGDARHRLHQATVSLRAQAEAAEHREAVTLAVVRDWLEQTLTAGVSARGFLGGSVTIAAMLPMRAVPVRALFVCGLDDESFPRRDQSLPFDLISAKSRPGDRSRRLDDRQLFLDLLLSARDRLHLCFVGRSAKDNAEAAPSVVLSELFAHVDRTCVVAGEANAARDLMIVPHPLQAWSPRYGPSGDPRLFTYARRPAPRELDRTREAPWCPPDTDVLPAPEFVDDRLALDDLLEFWWNPCRAFLRHGVRVRLLSEQEQSEDSEPFTLDSLARYQLQDEAVQRALRGEPERDDDLAITRARGVLPVGGHGEISYRAMQNDTDALLREARSYANSSERRIAITIDDLQLHGAIDGFTTSELVCIRVSKLKPKDHLRAWIKHLVLTLQHAQAGEQADPCWPTRTRVLASDGAWQFSPLPADDARSHLRALIDYYRQGLQRPLPFFERASHAVGKVLNQKRKGDPMKSAQTAYYVKELDKAWLHDEGDDSTALCMRGRDPFAGGEDSEFFAIAQTIWQTAFAQLLKE